MCLYRKKQQTAIYQQLNKSNCYFPLYFPIFSNRWWPTTAMTKSIVHGKISISTAASKSIFTSENTVFTSQNHSLFHGTNTFSWCNHFLVAQTLFHSRNTFSWHKHFLMAKSQAKLNCTNLETMLLHREWAYEDRR